MDRFEEVKQFNHPALERRVLKWWQKHHAFEKSIHARKAAPVFSFYEGPPTANGRPGIHHVISRTIKDSFCRYKTMKGFRVERKAGWDTHGLPVEIEVEKRLGLESRAQVEEYGIAPYNAACRESVLEYKELWDDLTVRMGYWVNLDDPYVTFTNEYIESVWWLLKQIYDKDLLYRGYKIQWYSPGSHTVLSSHEVSLGYKEVQDPSVYVRFPLHSQPGTAFLAWTTTPWTLISNAALAVGEKIPYVKIKLLGESKQASGKTGEYLILAKERLSVISEDHEVVEEYTGKDLLGQTYEPVFPYFKDDVAPGMAWRVVSANFVTTEDGTGIVHMAPAFGADDYTVGQQEDLPLLNPITPDGTFTEQIALVAGDWFKDADKKIVRDMRERGLLYKQETYLHNYPHDWRKGTPLMSYPVESWFIRTTALKDRLVELNKTINWQPDGIGTGRFGDWLANNVDWALSRRRYWGTPLPIWVNDKDPDDHFIIGSISDLREYFGRKVPKDAAKLDLHRPFIDTLTVRARKGGTYRRVPDLIDVWFDSGAMPFAQWHYPFENKEKFEQTFPADFIAEGVDQTRGWFYTLHAIGTLVMDSVAYKNVVVNGLVLDEEGNKMSKSRGNAVDPFQVIEQYGADVVRWSMMSNSPPWENQRFGERGLMETQRKFFSTLENVYGFFATYANIDGFTFAGSRIPISERAELDRWIISRLHSTITLVDEGLDAYHPTKACRAVEQFVDDLSNWYLRRSRRRFWSAKKANGQGDDQDKQAAYQTVYECLMAVAKLMSPVAPFFGEWLYQSLNQVAHTEKTPSVHLAMFPAVRENEMDAELEHQMDLARSIASITLALRNEAAINTRQPLRRILVVTGTGVEKEAVDHVSPIILDEVNIKAVEYMDATNTIINRSAKPNFKRLGKRLGPLMKGVNQQVRALDDAAISDYLEEGALLLYVDGEKVVLGPEDLDVTSEGVEGWLVGQEGGVTVALDTSISEALMEEGLARESVNRVQSLRKKANFEVTDRIVVQFKATEKLAEALGNHADWIRNETLALELHEALEPSGEATDTFQIGEEELTVGLKRVS